MCNSGIGRNVQEFLHFLPIPDVQKCRNSALHLFKLTEWSLSHPRDMCNSGIGRNVQEFLHFLPIPDVQKCRNSALHLFMLNKWSLSHPRNTGNSGIGRNDQESDVVSGIWMQQRIRNSWLWHVLTGKGGCTLSGIDGRDSRSEGDAGMCNFWE
jgi:hypothetical protein